MPEPIEPVTLRAGDLVLRPWQDADLPEVTRICQDPEISRWTPVPAPYSAADADEWIAKVRARIAAGTAQDWAVTEAATGRLLASVGLSGLDRAYPEVGFYVAAEARGTGVATAAARVACRWAFDRGAPKIRWLALVGNESSWRVAHHLGFAYEGRLLAEVPHADGPRTDAWIGALLPGALGERDHPLPFGPDPVLVDGDVTVRRYREDDVDAWLPLRNADDVVARGHGGRARRRLTRAEAWQALCVDAVTDRMTGRGRELAITVDGAVAGDLSFRVVNDACLIGWWVGPGFRGRRLAGRAAALLVPYLADLGLRRVEARIHVDNVGSQRVAEQAGLRRDGTLSRGAPWDGPDLGDAYLYGLALDGQPAGGAASGSSLSTP